MLIRSRRGTETAGGVGMCPWLRGAIMYGWVNGVFIELQDGLSVHVRLCKHFHQLAV